MLLPESLPPEIDRVWKLYRLQGYKTNICDAINLLYSGEAWDSAWRQIRRAIVNKIKPERIQKATWLELESRYSEKELIELLIHLDI